MIKCVVEVKNEKLLCEIVSKIIFFVEFFCCDVGVDECFVFVCVFGVFLFVFIRFVDLLDNKISVMGIW